MTMPDDEELSRLSEGDDELARALAEARATRPAPAELRSIAAALDRALDPGGGGGGGGGGESVAPAAPGAGGVLAPLAIAATVILGLGGAGWLAWDRARPAPTEPTVFPIASGAPEALEPDESLEPAQAPTPALAGMTGEEALGGDGDEPVVEPPDVDAPLVTLAPRRASRTARRPPRAAGRAPVLTPPTPVVATPRPDPVPSELALLEQARATLRARPAEALARANEHRQRYPRGSLAEEREALAIEALARLDRRDDAQARADAFRARWPSSIHARRISAMLAP